MVVVVASLRTVRGTVIVLLFFIYFGDAVGPLRCRAATKTRVTSSLALAIRMRRFPPLLVWRQEPSWRSSTCAMYADVLCSDVDRRHDPFLSIKYCTTVDQGHTVRPPDPATDF